MPFKDTNKLKFSKHPKPLKILIGEVEAVVKKLKKQDPLKRDMEDILDHLVAGSMTGGEFERETILSAMHHLGSLFYYYETHDKDSSIVSLPQVLTLAEILNLDGKPVHQEAKLGKDENSDHYYKGVIQDRHFELTKKLYESLYSYVANFWRCEYPVDPRTNIVIFENKKVIEEWMKTRKQLSSSPKCAYGDFLREYKICNQLSKDDDDIDRNIVRLLSITHYDDLQKAKIKTWLKANGGQHNNRFIDDLLKSKEYSDLVCAMVDTYGRKFGKMNNWYSQGGKIYFEMDISCFSMLQSDESMREEPAVIAIDKSGETHRLLQNAAGFADTFEEIKKSFDDHTTLPLIKFKAKLRLEFAEDGDVIPVIEKFVVESNTNYFHPPKIYKKLAPELKTS